MTYDREEDFQGEKIHIFLTECYYVFQKNSENRYESLSLILLWYCRSSFQCMQKNTSRKFYKIFYFELHRSNNMKLSKQRQRFNLGIHYLCIYSAMYLFTSLCHYYWLCNGQKSNISNESSFSCLFTCCIWLDGLFIMTWATHFMRITL